ncbi:MAG: hypothetical protein JO360_02595 [Acidobacteria bacterium]|nr:hypothetical protein [Acidobacteriota bacterium]
MKAFRALLLVLVLSVCAFAGDMPCGRDGDMPNGKDGDIPNGKVAVPDATADVILTVLQSVLPLL